MPRKTLSDRFRRKRSGILFLITGLTVLVFVLFGLLSTLLFRSSEERLIDKSIERMIETEMQSLVSASSYIAELLLPAFEEKVGSMSVAELVKALMNKELSEAQVYVIEEMKKMVASGLFGLASVSIIMPPSPLNAEPMVIAASDETLIYEWAVPDYVMDIVVAGGGYIYREEGFPEFGMQGPHSIIANATMSPTSGSEVVYLFVKPMGEEVAEMNAFYDAERERTNLMLWLTLAVSVLAAAAVTFFLLSLLIRKRITQPIDEIAASAEEVMQGNLDVEVSVHEGGEFEGLERAFKEMVESFRLLIERSTQGE